MLLVAGASSSCGREVVRRLLEQHVPTRVFVRHEADARRFLSLGAEVVQGDIRDFEAVTRAVRGVETVISLVGRHFARTEDDLWQVDAIGTENLIRAAKDQGAEKFILLSVLWADRDLAPFLLRAKRHAESVLETSGLNYAIVRPSMFILGPSSLVGTVGPTVERWGLAFVPGPDSKPVSFIAESDLADALVRLALGEEPERRIYEIGGPQSLTLAEAAHLVGTVIGKRVRIVPLPRSLLRLARRVSRRFSFGAYEAALFLEMLADHGYAVEQKDNHLAELLGRAPRSARDVLRAHYQRQPRTAWRDSNYGTLLFRAR